MVWSEDALHRWLFAEAARESAKREIIGAAGDDAVFLRASKKRQVICVDHTIEGVHVELGTSPAKTGRKAVDRALSDLAASAARPRALLLALSAPRETNEKHLRGLLRAVRRRGNEFGAPLVGGDLACAPGPCRLAVTALGEFAGAGRPPARERARVGDVLLCTGPLGGSGLGRHLCLQPRLEEGRWLQRRGATALMDTTDGLGRDLGRLARAAGVRIELEAVPLHRDGRRAARLSGRSPLDHALSDGEDHELLACLPQAKLAGVMKGARQACPGLTILGRLKKGAGVWLVAPLEAGPARRLVVGGWDHGRS